MRVDATFLGGPYHGQRRIILRNDCWKVAVAPAFGVARDPGAVIAPMMREVRYIPLDKLANGSTLFMVEGR